MSTCAHEKDNREDGFAPQIGKFRGAPGKAPSYMLETHFANSLKAN